MVISRNQVFYLGYRADGRTIVCQVGPYEQRDLIHVSEVFGGRFPFDWGEFSEGSVALAQALILRATGSCLWACLGAWPFASWQVFHWPHAGWRFSRAVILGWLTQERHLIQRGGVVLRPTWHPEEQE